MLKVLRDYPGIETRYLMIGEGGVFARPTGVQTVLGSCVAVTFFCPRKRIGSIFHSLLPTEGDYAKSDPHPTPYRYVDTSIRRCWEAMSEQGMTARQVECKVFGGANALMPGEYGMGEKNVRTAFETLASLNIRVLKSNVGGPRGRKLLFLTHTGEVYVKHLRDTGFAETLKKP